MSMRAAKTSADVIVFCGVLFMAETAAIVSPDKKVILPRLDAGCPLADMVTPEALVAKRKSLNEIPVVTYVNSPAAVKALSTVCCTSANSVAVVNRLGAQEVLMVPDRNLAQYTAAQTGKTIHYWNGYCPVHEHLTAEQVLSVKEKHPNAIFMAHPECRPEVLSLADQVLSTSGMLRFAKESKNTTFVVGTEEGILHPLQRENPHKTFYEASETMICQDMKRISLTDVLHALEKLEPEIKIPKEVREPAFHAVQKMLDISRSNLLSSTLERS